MEGNNVEKVLKHAKILRILIWCYTALYAIYFTWRYFFENSFMTVFGENFSRLYLLLVGFPVTAYAIWYILNLSPNREHNKTGNVLGLLFFGIIGLWMTYPRESKLLKRLKAQNSRFSIKT